MAPTVAFVTGANRGLGLGLVKGFVAKPDYIVVAAVRDPAHVTAQELTKLPTGEGSRIIVHRAICLRRRQGGYRPMIDILVGSLLDGVDHLDYVVANAGIAKNYPFVKDVKRADILEHFAPPVPSALYGASKSILPWYGVRINAEDEWLNTFVLDPGWVQTEMGNSAAKGWGIESAPHTIEKCTDGMVRVITEGPKEQYGGKVVLYTGDIQEW
ncbi:hypothetical protein PoHVEF18_002526 [Penicillium ochrochloron]